MTEVASFAERIEIVISDANRTPHWSPDDAKLYMVEVEVHRRHFDQLASLLSDTVVQPRLATLASFFTNAGRVEVDPPRQCTCWFEHSDPADTRVTVAVEHDVCYQQIAICYDAHMMPTFVPFNEHDRTTLALDEVNDVTVADWVERRLLEFITAYLRIDSNGKDVGLDPAIDPVCGMRIGRSTAAAIARYLGHKYYFCAVTCQAKFSRDPLSYVHVKAM